MVYIQTLREFCGKQSVCCLRSSTGTRPVWRVEAATGQCIHTRPQRPPDSHPWPESWACPAASRRRGISPGHCRRRSAAATAAPSPPQPPAQAALSWGAARVSTVGDAHNLGEALPRPLPVQLRLAGRADQAAADLVQQPVVRTAWAWSMVTSWLGRIWWTFDFLKIHFSSDFSLEGHLLWSIIY